VNIWLADDEACLEGGGLALYSHVPPLEQAAQSVNREFRDKAEEQARLPISTASPSRHHRVCGPPRV
jgi:hypothetical protein